MGLKMNRGKQQVLLGLLPGKTFDFAGAATIARVTEVRGIPRNDLNAAVVLRKVSEDAQAWATNLRPVLRDDVLSDPTRFILLDPSSVQAEMFPKVFWCKNQACGKVVEGQQLSTLPTQCPTCRGDLAQLPFVKIHRCGALAEWNVPSCPRCGNSRAVTLDKRGSERISNFRWRCRQCGWQQGPYAGRCSSCTWPDPSQRDMEPTVHRSGRTFYPQTATLLNVPKGLETFFAVPEWWAVSAAKFLRLPEVANRPLDSFVPTPNAAGATADPGLSGADLDGLLQRQQSGQLTPEQMIAELAALRASRQQQQQQSSPSAISQAIIQRTGVGADVWVDAGQELLECILPSESGQTNDLLAAGINPNSPLYPAAQQAKQMGFAGVTLSTDFPIITATYGFSRAEHSPTQCRLNPFPPARDFGGRLPIYVDEVQADALLLTLSPDRVRVWLDQNGYAPVVPPGSEPTLAERAFFVQLLHNVPLRQTIDAAHPSARMVFGLLHTLSHLCVRQAALLCGLDRTSLSEYLLPRSLSFAIYCNHRFGATIGALSALFEQSLAEWLTAVRDTRRCVYDPVCAERTGTCHACTHLAETSCRYFNLNLNRALLFGGRDPHLGDVKVGFFDPSLA